MDYVLKPTIKVQNKIPRYLYLQNKTHSVIGSGVAVIQQAKYISISLNVTFGIYGTTSKDLFSRKKYQAQIGNPVKLGSA